MIEIKSQDWKNVILLKVIGWEKKQTEQTRKQSTTEKPGCRPLCDNAELVAE